LHSGSIVIHLAGSIKIEDDTFTKKKSTFIIKLYDKSSLCQPRLLEGVAIN
jgi:hypothetical protein